VHYTALAEQEECRRLRPRPPGFVVPNSIDLAAWRNDAVGALRWRERHGIAAEDFLFLNSGRLHHKKGLELLVEAAARLPRNRAWKLVFAGPDEDGTGGRLRRLGREAQLDGRLILTGALDTPELSAAYSAAGLFLFPSLNENFGNVAVEALACGTRVALAPDVGCRRELAETPGVVVLPRRVEDWLGEMTRALDRPPLDARVIADRRRELEQRYSREAVAGAMEAAYRGLLAQSIAAGACPA
jgi:glycosyltransferase involved in cell wall biosynthesis